MKYLFFIISYPLFLPILLLDFATALATLGRYETGLTERYANWCIKKLRQFK